MRSANDRMHEPLYSISVAAKLCEVHEQTLRMYERQGLLKPERAKGKNRLYSEADIIRIKQIQTLTQTMGVNLAGVELILQLREKMDALRQEMEAEVARIHSEAVKEIERLVNQLKMPVAYKTPLPAKFSERDEADDIMDNVNKERGDPLNRPIGK